MNNKWHKRFLEIAQGVSAWSKDPSTKVGAVIVGNQNQIVSQGFNGFPRGVDDSNERLVDRETKYKFVIHAEANAIYNAIHNGSKVEGSTIYVFGLPVCNECAKAIIQTGIKKVVYCSEPNPLWEESSLLSKEMFAEVGVELIKIDI